MSGCRWVFALVVANPLLSTQPPPRPASLPLHAPLCPAPPRFSVPAANKTSFTRNKDYPLFRCNADSEKVHSWMCASASRSHSGDKWNPVHAPKGSQITCGNCAKMEESPNKP